MYQASRRVVLLCWCDLKATEYSVYMRATQETRYFQLNLLKMQRPIYVQFEHIIKELCRKQKYTIQENLTQVLNKFW